MLSQHILENVNTLPTELPPFSTQSRTRTCDHGINSAKESCCMLLNYIYKKQILRALPAELSGYVMGIRDERELNPLVKKHTIKI